MQVEAPARLHLGFLDLDGGLGRRFGSLGLTVDGLSTRLRLRLAKTAIVEGVGEVARARRLLDTLTTAWSLPPVEIGIEATIPAHAGLGSGTQLALALGVGLARLTGRAASARSVAQLLERGRRSGIGIGAFEQGGFLLDGGRADDLEPPPLIARLSFPEPWRLLLVFDDACEGLHGSSETRAFGSLPPFSAELAGHLCRLTVMRLLPGVATADIGATGAAVGEIQKRVGDHFAPAQGGRFTSRAVGTVLDWLEQQGIAGVGQSSWGPTGFALLASESMAEQFRAEAERRFGGRFRSLRFLVSRARNHGAEVKPG